MRDEHFEWDDTKAASNWRKHRVSFDQARLAFDDPNAIDEPDDDPDEERWQLTGLASTCLLFVVHTTRGKRTRIISAREADRYEQDRYSRQTIP